MQVVWKFPMSFNMEAECVLKIPINSDVLSVALKNVPEDNEKPTLWALVKNPYAATIPRKFLMIGTGWDVDISKPLDFIGTVHFSTGLVFHIFETPNKVDK